MSVLREACGGFWGVHKDADPLERGQSTGMELDGADNIFADTAPLLGLKTCSNKSPRLLQSRWRNLQGCHNALQLQKWQRVVIHMEQGACHQGAAICTGSGVIQGFVTSGVVHRDSTAQPAGIGSIKQSESVDMAAAYIVNPYAIVTRRLVSVTLT